MKRRSSQLRQMMADLPRMLCGDLTVCIVQTMMNALRLSLRGARGLLRDGGTIVMKHGGLSDGAGQLKMAADKLEEGWEAARPVWDDIVSRTMEEEQLAPLMQQLRSTLDAVARISTRNDGLP